MTSKTSGRRTGGRHSISAPRRERSFVERYRGLILAGTAVVVLVALGVIFALKFGPSNSGKEASSDAAPADPAVIAALTAVPQATFDAVGAGTAGNAPKAIQDTALTQDGKPAVLYMGAEYCPFCAAERWPLIVALSRFGSFSNLYTTRSSASDVYPSTPTFTFYGGSYTSQYLALQSVELTTNQLNGKGGYTALQSPTAEQQALLQKYTKGSIPFVDFGGKYALLGRTYDLSLLAGKDWSAIAGQLADPSTPLARSIVGSANVLTAAMCQETGGQPANVCTSAGVQAAAATLGK